MEYTTRLNTVCDFRSGKVFAASTVVYSVRNSWRRTVSRAWNATLVRFLKDGSLLRVSIHPPDYSHPAVWRQITGLLEAAVASRTATTYEEWIAEQRLTRGI
jgi:uncharacterized protein